MEGKCELRLDSPEYRKEGGFYVQLDYRPFKSYIAQESGWFCTCAEKLIEDKLKIRELICLAEEILSQITSRHDITTSCCFSSDLHWDIVDSYEKWEGLQGKQYEKVFIFQEEGTEKWF